MNLPRAGSKFCTSKCRVYAHRASKRQPKIPVALTSLDCWVRWKLVKRNGRLTKMPITLAGNAASSTDPNTWTSFEDASAAVAGDGLGFVLGGGIACLDIDHCLINGKPNRLAQSVLDRTPGAYVEVSPSGDGLHIWGTAPELRGKVRDGIEAYSTGRYITVTGNIFRHGTLVDLSDFF